MRYAQTLSDVLFASDYSDLKADNLIRNFEGDSRLRIVERDELFELPLIKLVSKYNLVTSNCQLFLFIHSKCGLTH